MDGWGLFHCWKNPLGVEMFLHRIKVIRSTLSFKRRGESKSRQQHCHTASQSSGLEVQVFLLSPVSKSADDTVFDVFSHFKYSINMCSYVNFLCKPALYTIS